MDRIARNQAHLSALVDDLLGYTRTEAGQLTLRREPVILADVLTGIETYIGPEAREKGLQLDIQRLDRSLIVTADAERVRQILLNFLSNAIKATPEGGRIQVGGTADGSRARVYVIDTGIGIPADQIERVFEPFYQVEQGKTRRFPGVGLGLTIARALARKMGGNVTLESTQGSGTTATLLLPRAG
jgi:signal transduction histidine kinase